jgi:predicted RNA-binding protein YlxR (DUF448 family)
MKKSKEKGAFLRQCVGCGKRGLKNEFIRIAKTPDGKIVIDGIPSSGGRGAYICNDAECLKKAVKNGRLSKNLRSEIPETIINELKLVTNEKTDG